MAHKPFISPETRLPEITIKVIILSIILAIVLAVANVYLALKIGILTSASIPAAIISMGILRFFRKSNILENNLVQTAASAGEAVAGGIVFTIPALIIIHYWTHFSYWENFFIAFCGSVLGVLFSIPLRRVLMTEPHLRYPEGRAIAEVLQMGSSAGFGLKALLYGGAAGAIIEFLQTGLKIVANSVQLWFSPTRMIFGFGAGFSATMIGAGYLIGFDVGFSIFLGAVIGWIISVPILSEVYSFSFQNADPTQVVTQLLSQKIRYMGIGAMLVAGLWTLLTLLKPFYLSLKSSLAIFNKGGVSLIRTERDMPMSFVLTGVVILLLLTAVLFYKIFPLNNIGLASHWHFLFILVGLLYILIIGFVFSAITGYFSGLVGVSASPGSAIVIAGLLIAAFLIHLVLGFGHLPDDVLRNAAAIAIIVGAIVTGSACIANDNIQDLKVGHIIGATPWKQQLMLLLGAVVASAIVPLVMQLLFNVYGIAGVVPRPGMDISQSLPAPPAAIMAALTKGVFHGNLPWHIILMGGGIMVLVIIINEILKIRHRGLSVLGVAIGIYLPLATTVPLFVGGLFSFLVNRKLKAKKEKLPAEKIGHAKQRGLLLACGLVAGSALMDVVLAIPFAIARSPDVLQINIPHWHLTAEALGLLTVIGLGFWFYYLVISKLRV